MTRRRLLAMGVVVIALMANVLIVRGIRDRMMEKPQITAAPVGHRVILADAGMSAGPADAPTSIWILGDYECPACGRLETVAGERLRVLAERGDVRLAYIHSPLPTRQHGRLAASASYCAGSDRQWELHRWLYAEPSAWTRAPDAELTLVERAAMLGIDAVRFRTCLGDTATARLVDRDLRAARRLGVDRVPTILVDDARLRLRRSPAELLAHVEELVNRRALRAGSRR